MPQDWFSANAPQQDDWFGSNAPKEPQVQAPNWWDRLSSFGSGLADFGSTAASSGFGNPVAVGMNFYRDPQGTIDASRQMIDSLFIHPVKSLWEGVRSPEPYGMLEGTMRAGGLSPENIKEDINSGSYGAVAMDVLPQAALGYLTHKAVGGGGSRAPISRALVPDEILSPIVEQQKRLIGKVEPPMGAPKEPLQLGAYNEPITEISGVPTYEGPRQIEGTAPQRLGLPALGETVETRGPGFVAGERGIVDTSLDYPIDLVDQAKLRGTPITPEDLAEIVRVRPDLNGQQILALLGEKGTLLDSEMGSLGSLNPLDVASGRTGNNIATGMPFDAAQADPVFGALVPDRMRSPNEQIMPSTNPVGMRGPRVEAPILEQPLGGRVVNAPRIELPYNPNMVDVTNRALSPEPFPSPSGAKPNIPPFVASTIEPPGAAALRPKAPKEFPKVYKPGAVLEPTRTNIDSPEIQYQLRDVGKDMNPAVAKAGTSSMSELQIAAAQVRAQRPGYIRSTYDKVLGSSGWGILEKMGPGGTELSRFMRRTRAEGSQQAGEFISKYRTPIDKLSDKEFATAVDHIENKTQATSPKIQQGVDAIKALLDESGIYAENSGMVMSNPSGQLTKFQRMREGYFPHKWAPGTFNEGSLVNELIQKGMSPTQAQYVVDHGIKSGPRLISPQHMRSLNLPGYLKTKGALYEHVDDLIVRSKEAQKYGPTDLGNKNSPLMEVIGKTENPEAALEIAREQLGRIKKDPDLEKVANAVNTFEATVKLPLFALQLINQPVAIAMRTNTSNFVRGLVDTIKNVKSAEDTGALQTTAINILRETGQNRVTKGASKLFGWQRSEEFLRSWAGNAGKIQADTLFDRLKKNPADLTARAQLDDLLLENIDEVVKQDKLTPQQQKIAGFRMSELTQGLVDPADLPPMWNDNPLWRIPLMFKRFAFQQNRILKDSFKSVKTPQERITMAMKMIGLYAVGGEINQDIRKAISALASGEDPLDAIMNRPDHPLVRVLDDISGSYALGFAGEIVEQIASENPERVLSHLVGPGIGAVTNIATSAFRSARTGDIAPLGREIIRETTPFGYATSKMVFPPQ